MYLWDPSAPTLVTGDPNTTIDNGRPQLLDGDFDAGVIAHEYGHGVSNRLTGGPSNVSCLSTSKDAEQMGEGWSDFFAVSLTMRAGDNGADPARGRHLRPLPLQPQGPRHPARPVLHRPSRSTRPPTTR